MKKIFIVLCTSLALVLGGCASKSEVDQRLSEIEERLTKLEDAVKKLNGNVETIQTLLNGKWFVESVSDLADGAGYKLVLVDKDGNRLEKYVYNGKDGKDGVDGEDGQDGHDGQTPMVSVRKDQDGNYYWTVNGEWLLVDGEKVRANGLDGEDGSEGPEGPEGPAGEDGLTPEFKVENGKWYVRLGEEGEWQDVGAAVPDALFLSVDAASKEDVVVFTLADGTVFEVPKVQVETKLQILVDDSAFAAQQRGETKTATYEVKAPAGISYTIDSYEPQGWKVIISEPKENKGSVTITSAHAYGKVLLVVTGSDGSNFVKVLRVGQEDESETLYAEWVVEAAGGSYQLPSDASKIEKESGANWITVSGKTLKVSENTGYDSRTAQVTYTSEGKNYTLIVTQLQKDAIVLTASTLDVSAEAQTQTVVLKTNVSVEASCEAAWLAVAPLTKGLVEREFTLQIQANEATSARSAKVVFTSGELSQELTVNQVGKGEVPPTPPTPGSGDFELVTDASDLSEGDEILIVNVAASKAISTTQNNNNRPATSISISANVISADDLGSDVQVITLEGGAGSWNMAVDGGYLANKNGGTNALVTVSTLGSNASWTISVASNGEATIKAASGERNLLRYNPNASNSSPLFACYKSGQEPVAIFRRSSTPATPVTEYTEMGLYLSASNTRTYAAGADQYVREYNGNVLTYVLVNPAAQEQVEISGYNKTMSVDASVTVQVNWKKNKTSVLSQSYSWNVLKKENGLVWLGDTKGKGVIVKE